MLKKYWDIILGALAGIFLAVIAEFELTTVQLYYSVIILVLVCIGLLRSIKQSVERKKPKREHTIIDSLVDGQKSIRAISLAQSPTKEGEKIGEIIIILWGETKRTMEKLKTFWAKFKGYMLTIALAVLTLVEMLGAPINTLCGGVLTINGVEVLPMVTLACTAIVGMVSNGFTKEQREKIKALFGTSATNQIIHDEMKKTLKTKSAELAQFNSALTKAERELTDLEKEFNSLNTTLLAKKEMAAMIPQLATTEEVAQAAQAVEICRVKVNEKKAEIAVIKSDIDKVTTVINALKSQL